MKTKEKGSAIYEKAGTKALQMEINETNNGKNIGLNNGGGRVDIKNSPLKGAETKILCKERIKMI